jgi:hypothetical protein
MNPQIQHIKRGLLAALLGTTLAACGAPAVVTQPTPRSTPTAQPAATPQPVAGAPTIVPAPAAATAQPIIGFNPASGRAGTVVSIFGSGYAAGERITIRLGLPQPMGEALVSAQASADGRWSASLTMPDALPSGAPIPAGELYLVAMNDQNLALASAPFAYAAAPGEAQPTPAADALHAVELFLTAAQQDRSGKLASVYAGGALRTALKDGVSDIGAALQEQNPFQSFTVDGVIGSDERNTYVKGALSYGGGSAYDRIFTVSNREEGAWRVFKVTIPDAAPAADLSHAAAADAVRMFLGAWTSGGDVKPYLAANIRAEMEAGRPLHAILGLHPVALASFDVRAAEDRPSEVLFVPATLTYQGFSEERVFTLAVEDHQWKINESMLR